jgi:hypothetical protein
MIQRIQTVYLLLVALAILVITFTMSFADINNQHGVYHLSPFGLSYDSLIFNKKQSFISFPFYLVFIFYLILVFRTVFSFKNLELQVRLSFYTLIGSVLIFASVTILPYIILALFIKESAEISYNIGFYLLVTVIPFAYLAWKNIKNDKSLIDSVDRIR